jgi:hypothetical protein
VTNFFNIMANFKIQKMRSRSFLCLSDEVEMCILSVVFNVAVNLVFPEENEFQLQFYFLYTANE